MRDKVKLALITEYVNSMSPVIRPAILLPPEEMAYNQGWDTAMWQAQIDLSDILEEE